MLVNIDGSILDAEQVLRDLDRVDCEESLYTFLQYAWRWFDPSPFTPGWPIEAVAEHLEAVADGEIKRLIINIPPRCAKSSLVSVAFPSWVWAQSHEGPTSGPGVQFILSSYAGQLSMRDNVKARRLIESPWYRSLWGDRVMLTSDQNTKGRFDNSRGGVRIATSVGAAVTGEGGDIIIVDDPNGAQDATSEAVIESTIEWWDSAMSTRLNRPKEGAYIIIQQRLAENDLTGHVLEKSDGEWTHLMLPMRYEADRSFVTSIGWQDPRTEEGELLWPERFGDEEVSSLERRLGPWAAAGQLQQRPEVKGGGIIKREDWRLWERDRFPDMDYVIASLDTAYTTKQAGDYSALVVLGVFSGEMVDMQAQAAKGANGQIVRTYNTNTPPKVMLMNAWQERLELHELVNKVAEACRIGRVDKLLIENKAAGLSVAQEIRRLYGHEPWAVQLIDPKGQDKMARLYSVQHLFSEGMVYAPDRSWADLVITQAAAFPKAKHDDLVDALSQGMKHMRETGILIRGPEISAGIEANMQHTGKGPEPLYPV